MDQKIITEFKSHVSDAVHDKAQHTLKDSVLSLVTEDAMPADTDPAKEPLTHKHDSIGQRIADLVTQSFSSSPHTSLGITVTRTPNGWFRSGAVSISVESSSDTKTTRGSELARNIHEHTKQYLKEKQSRRSDSSLLAVPYKTVIAKFIQQTVNAIYNHTLTREEQVYYLNQLDAFISAVRRDKQLFAQDQVYKVADLHFEPFLLDVQRKISRESQALSVRTDAHQVHTWLQSWQTSLNDVLHHSPRWFYAAIHTQDVPDTLSDELNKLGRVYQQHLESQLMADAKGRIKISEKRLAHWQALHQRTQQKLQRHYPQQAITPTLLRQAAQQHIISWEQYYCYDVDAEVYNAEHLLWELLFYPQELPLSASALKELCYDKVLNVYRALGKADPHHGFLLLQADVEMAYPATLRVIEINEAKDVDGSQAKLIAQLSERIKTSVQADCLAHLSADWRPGILAEVDSLMPEPSSQTGDAAALLRAIKYDQIQLAHLCSCLATYLKLLPSTGEIIGAIALGPHLRSAVASMIAHGGRLQKNILALNQLLRFGSSEAPGIQTLLLQYPTSRLKLTQSDASVQEWLAHESSRWQEGMKLSQAIGKCISIANQLNQHCAAAALAERVQSAERLFVIADDLSSPFLTAADAEQRPAVKAVMRGFSEVVHSGLASTTETNTRTNTGSRENNHTEVVPVIGTEEKQHMLTSSTLTTSTIHAPRSPEPPLPDSSPATLMTCAFAPLQAGLNKLVAQALVLLDAKENTSAASLQQRWQQLLGCHQEPFYQAFAAIRAPNTDLSWGLWFQAKIGVLFLPLPLLHKPRRFLWWHRHHLSNRDLFFSMLSVSALMTYTTKHAEHLSPTQQANLQQLLAAEQGDAAHEQKRRSLWFDSSRCALKHKYSHWQNQLKRYAHQAQLLVPMSRPILPVSSPSKDSIQLQPTTVSTPSVAETPVPVPITRPVVATSQLLSAAMPLDLVPNSNEWQHYQQQLAQETQTRQEALCLQFLAATLLRVQQGQLQISNTNQPKHATQFQAAIVLFWQVIKVTDIATHAVGVFLGSLHDNCSKYPSSIQQRFFVNRAPNLLESYQGHPALANSLTPTLT